MADAERCVMCGAIIPEGGMVCPVCERKIERGETPGKEKEK